MNRDLGDFLFEIRVAEGRYGHPLDLARHNARVYSQNGEDGIIAEVFRRIGVVDRFFIEIGIGNGLENNTRFLLEQGWQGIWLDTNTEQAEQLFSQFVSSGHLKICGALIDVDNINEL